METTEQKSIFRHTHGLREYDKARENLFELVEKEGRHLNENMLKLNHNLTVTATEAANEYADFLELLHSKGFKFSHGVNGQITDIYKEGKQS